MPPGQGEVARQWFIPGEGIDRTVISTDIQRYLGNDATVRPGAGTGEYQGVNGYWIKAYRNLTSAMIADLRADSQRWRQEQRQPGVNPTSYVGSRTYDESNAAGGQRNSPSLDNYGNSVPSRAMEGRAQRPPGGDPMSIDTPTGRPPPGQAFGQQGGYYQQDPRAQQYQDPSRYPGQPNQRDGRPQRDQYAQQPEYAYPSPAATTVDPRERPGFPNQQSGYPQPPPGQYDQYGRPVPTQNRGQGYPDQNMADYGPPDSYGRYAVNPAYPQDRPGAGYQQPQAAPPGYTRQGEYYVPMSSGFEQQNIMPTSGPAPDFYGGTPQAQQPRGQNPAYPPYGPPADTRYAPPSRDREPNQGRGQGHGDRRRNR